MLLLIINLPFFPQLPCKLPVIEPWSALKLQARTDFYDENGELRLAGEEWLCYGSAYSQQHRFITECCINNSLCWTLLCHICLRCFNAKSVQDCKRKCVTFLASCVKKYGCVPFLLLLCVFFFVFIISQMIFDSVLLRKYILRIYCTIAVSYAIFGVYYVYLEYQVRRKKLLASKSFNYLLL